MSVTEIAAAPLAPAGTWTADPVHSSVSFEIVHAGVNTFRGGFTDFAATLSGSTLEGRAKVASIDVKDEQLNAHLQTPDFFDAARHPELAFRADELRKGEDGVVDGTGELTIRGVSRPVVLTGRVADAPATDPFGRERLGLRLQATIDRTEFGVSWNAPNQSGGDYLANDVTLVAELALVRQEG